MKKLIKFFVYISLCTICVACGEPAINESVFKDLESFENQQLTGLYTLKQQIPTENGIVDELHIASNNHNRTFYIYYPTQNNKNIYAGIYSTEETDKDRIQIFPGKKPNYAKETENGYYYLREGAGDGMWDLMSDRRSKGGSWVSDPTYGYVDSGIDGVERNWDILHCRMKVAYTDNGTEYDIYMVLSDGRKWHVNFTESKK